MNTNDLDYVTDPRSLGMTLRLLRTEQRKSLQDVARATGIHYSTLSHFELNHRDHISLEHLLKLLDYYGVKLKLEEAVS